MKIGLQIPCFDWPGSDENAGSVLAEVGFQQVILNMPDAHQISPVARVAEVVIPSVGAY